MESFCIELALYVMENVIKILLVSAYLITQLAGFYGVKLIMTSNSTQNLPSKQSIYLLADPLPVHCNVI
jgi:hypothetical protein|tara:strand:- start:283 stop:489 length:207 start_codon:yes stop_codon:yes gene_type:complete